MEKFFCCCGLSATFPMCDGSQMIARTHALGKLVSCGAPKPSGPPGDEASASSAREIATTE